MPPKSSSKKSAITWFTCEQCQTHITSKDRDNHEKACPISADTLALDFVKDETLYTTNLEKKSFAIEALNDLPSKQLNSLVFVSEGAMKLCGFHIGQRVVVTVRSAAQSAPVVRSVWPVPGKFLSTVFVSDEDYENNWSSSKGEQVKIEKLQNEPLPAKEIELHIVDSDVDSKSFPDISKLLHSEMRNMSFCQGSRVLLNFYNKKLKFVVKNCVFVLKNERSLEEQLEKLDLARSVDFFLVTNSTQVVVKCSKQEESKSNVQVKKKTGKDDIGGLEEAVRLVDESVQIGLGYQPVPKGVKTSRGVLLYGPTGCGKTMLCEALCNSTSAEVIRLNTNELFSKFLGETERNLQQYFDQAFQAYPNPSLMIIENINNICPKQETNEVVKRVSVAFLNILDGLSFKEEASRLFIVATTSSLENVNASIRRCGRFDSEVEIGAPNPVARLEIIEKHLKKVEHDLSADEVRDVANVTHGYVGSDLANLVYSAALKAANEGKTKVQAVDLNNALTQVKPSAMREVLIESPNVKWEDIGGQDDLKLKLKQAIEWPLLYPEKFERLGIKPPRGILMFGPPGCSKTMIAKALATESQVNFLSIKGPELFSMWVGESERAVREVFRKARQVAPSIIFFDEIDAIGGERSSDSASSVKERVLTQLLTELDGVDALRNVTIVAATNRPDMIDKALMRPGRIDRIVYVGLPEAETRREIFRIKLKKMPLAADVDLDEIVKRTEGYSGAEIQAVCHEAALKTLEESFDATEVKWSHFEQALKTVQPRTSTELLDLYREYMKQS